MLAAHNVYRRQIGNPPLVWSNRLAALAQSWANYLIQTGFYKHRPGGQYGENLFEVVGPSVSDKGIVDAWAAERSAYHHGQNSCSTRCGHYTQIIWRDTREVGCGVAEKGRRKIGVCNYDPPGNIIGERPY